ncbi:MAG: DUF4007 family protein [Roseiflexaceae bacterium]
MQEKPLMVHMPQDIRAFSFSGHETFVLRSNWLKKAYDLLHGTPDLFSLEDAFVRLGVGKNMAASIRYWGRVCHIFERSPDGDGHTATWLGHALLNDHDGWDPFLVTPSSRWLLHWQISSRPEAAYTWFYTFNQLRRGDFGVAQLIHQIQQRVIATGSKPPSEATLKRDIDCMLRCYIRPDIAQLGATAEDALHCPLYELNLLQRLPGQDSYRLVHGPQADLVDPLVAYAALQQARQLGRTSITLNELAYGERSPGRIFRLDEESLLMRLYHMEAATHGHAAFSDAGGIRQLIWRDPQHRELEYMLLSEAFAQERHYA